MSTPSNNTEGRGSSSLEYELFSYPQTALQMLEQLTSFAEQNEEPHGGFFDSFKQLFNEYPSLFIHVVLSSAQGKRIDKDMLLQLLTQLKKFQNKEITSEQGFEHLKKFIEKTSSITKTNKQTR